MPTAILVRPPSLPWLVAEQGSEIVGYAYASHWKRRYGYRFSVEVTVYLDPAYARQGIGTKHYWQLSL